MSLLIRNGTLVFPQGLNKADLRVEHGKIAALGLNLPAGGSRVLDVEGKLVFPGFIDPHTHFAGIDRLADDFTSGTRAALAGGTTTLLDFATQCKETPLSHALGRWHASADGNCSCHYGFHMAVTDWNDAVKAELPAMTAAGVTSYKIYFAYDALRLSDAAAYEVVKAVAAEGGVVSAHCENGDLVNAGIAAQKAMGRLSPDAHPLSRADTVEEEAVTRWLAIGELLGVPVNIVHLSARRALRAVQTARARGQTCYVETCPQYLLLTRAKYRLPGFEGAKYVCSPPLRAEEDCAALWAALLGGEIDTVGTDHCSFHFHGAKELGLKDFSSTPNGLPGVETRPVLLYTYGVAPGLITPSQMARVLAENPARLYGMYPQKGVLAVGSDADLVIWDRNYTSSISATRQVQQVDYTPYEGVKTVGRADTVLLRGEVVVSEGRIVAERRGRYVRRGRPWFWR